MELFYLSSCVPTSLFFSFFNVYAVQFCTLRIWDYVKVIEKVYSLFLIDQLGQPIAAGILN